MSLIILTENRNAGYKSKKADSSQNQLSNYSLSKVLHFLNLQIAQLHRSTSAKYFYAYA
jgi:hypothetical protein